jgi:hypothetical protein
MPSKWIIFNPRIGMDGRDALLDTFLLIHLPVNCIPFDRIFIPIVMSGKANSKKAAPAAPTKEAAPASPILLVSLIQAFS